MDKDIKILLLLVVLVPILAAPVGVPIMGYCALQQIRHSAGRIYGLGLALFNLLFFPLLLLDGLIVTGFTFGLLLIVRSAEVSFYYYPWREFLWIVGALSLVVAGLVDYAIIQAAWRTAKKMPNGPAIPSAGSEPSLFSSRAWKAACVIVVVSFVVGVIALTNQMHPLGVRRASPMMTPAISAQPAGGVRLAELTRSPVFGPVVERLVAEPAAPRYLWFDLDTGKSVAAADDFGPNHRPDDDEQARLWKIKTGVDVGAVFEGSRPGLLGFDLAALRVGLNQWESATPSAVLAAMSDAKQNQVTPMMVEGRAPATFLFKTREGGTGILQILGAGGNSRDLKIRYKLVQLAPGVTSTQSSQVEVLRVRLRQAEADLARMEKLHSQKLVSQDDYETIKSDRDVLAAEVAGNKAEIARLQIERADQKFARVQDLYQRKLASQQEFEEAKAARDILLAQAGLPVDVVDEYNALRMALVKKRDELVNATLKYPPGSVFIKELTNNIAEFSQRKQQLEKQYPLLTGLSSSASAYPSEMARQADRVLGAQQTHSNLTARYDAAMGITDFTSKDRALAALARDAGRAGDGDALLKSLRQITDFTVRDSAASEAAGLLTKSGVTAPALEAARLITDFTIRDRTLAALATDAAAAGDAKTVKEMLRIITDFTVRDQAAVESARALAKAGMLAPAMEVAKTITDFTRRDQMLSELAK